MSPVRKHETLKPLKIFTTPKGEKVIDFGQNLVGWVIVKANGKAGDKITIPSCRRCSIKMEIFISIIFVLPMQRPIIFYQEKEKKYLNLILLFMDFGI
jgi:hypothetical protein